MPTIRPTRSIRSRRIIRSTLAAAALAGAILTVASPADAAAATRVRWGALNMNVSIEGPFRCMNIRDSGLYFATVNRGQHKNVHIRRYRCTKGSQNIDVLQYIELGWASVRDNGWADAEHRFEVSYNTSPSTLFSCGTAVRIPSRLSRQVTEAFNGPYAHPPARSGTARCSNGTAIKVTAKLSEHLSAL